MSPEASSHVLHRLLLVDDDPLFRETIGDVLRHEGFLVTEAASGEEAEQVLTQVDPPFGLVLTDLVMPGKTGMDVLQTALAVNPRCTVLVFSGFASVREATEAVERGAYGMITKPLHLDQFRAILRRLLERIALIQERDDLLARVHSLEAQVEKLEAVKARMEMLAQRISPAASEPASDLLSDLERLAALKEKGLLNQEQLEQAKQAVMDRWAP